MNNKKIKRKIAYNEISKYIEEYDKNDNMVYYEDECQKLWWDYDGKNNIIHHKHFDNEYVEDYWYEYDDYNNMTRLKYSTNFTEFGEQNSDTYYKNEYNENNKLVYTESLDGKNKEWREYDDHDRVIYKSKLRIMNNREYTEKYFYTYNENNLIYEKRIIDGSEYMENYIYDTKNRLVDTTINNDMGKTIQYIYGENDLLKYEIMEKDNESIRIEYKYNEDNLVESEIRRYYKNTINNKNSDIPYNRGAIKYKYELHGEDIIKYEYEFYNE